MVEYDKFQKSLKHLELQFENYKALAPSQPELMKEAVAESVIQRFETCYDCMWKILKRYLVETLGIPEAPNSPKPVLRVAAVNDLFASPIEKWLIYADSRTSTSHDYSGEKAKACLEIMQDFVNDAIKLYEKMSGKEWV
jgi:nucleotidyltransferase substrate binding protein (TIGR01987 family)